MEEYAEERLFTLSIVDHGAAMEASFTVVESAEAPPRMTALGVTTTVMGGAIDTADAARLLARLGLPLTGEADAPARRRAPEVEREEEPAELARPGRQVASRPPLARPTEGRPAAELGARQDRPALRRAGSERL